MRVDNSKETYVNRDYKYKVVRLKLTTLELRSPGVVFILHTTLSAGFGRISVGFSVGFLHLNT